MLLLLLIPAGHRQYSRFPMSFTDLQPCLLEIGRAFELAGHANFPEAVLALRRGDDMTAAGETEVPRRPAVLDHEHQGEDQSRSYQYASHGGNIGIRGICLKR